jgi:hypothetical protein
MTSKFASMRSVCGWAAPSTRCRATSTTSLGMLLLVEKGQHQIGRRCQRVWMLDSQLAHLHPVYLALDPLCLIVLALIKEKHG